MFLKIQNILVMNISMDIYVDVLNNSANILDDIYGIWNIYSTCEDHNILSEEDIFES
jgi:hypothetical protein